MDGNQNVIDAYCGIGTISLAVAKHAKQVYGVEIVPAAIEDAKHNAKRNGIKNAKFVVGKAEEQFAKWQAAGLKPDVVIVDPPRKGLAESLIEATGKMGPKKVIYVSCNPATLVQQTERLYQTAIDNAGLDGNQTVIDAYCGIGTISLAVAKHAKQVYGVAIVPAAIEDAKHNANRNGIKKAKFGVG